MQGASSTPVSLADLRGVWELHSPTGSGSHLHESNFLRTVLDLYDSNFGKRLDMELLSAPTVIVLRDGVTRTVSRLKWGGFTDKVTVSGKLHQLAEGGFRDSPRALSSDALQVRVPFPQKPRNLHVTYYDGDLLVMQDSSGVADILWRQGGASARAFEGWRAAEEEEEEYEEEEEEEEEKEEDEEEEDEEDGEEEAKEMKKSAVTEKDAKSLDLENKGDGLKARYDYQKEEAILCHFAQVAEPYGKEKALRPLSWLVAQAKDAVESLRRKKQDMDPLRKPVEEEIFDCENIAGETDESVPKLKGIEESLLVQLSQLKNELNLAPRDEWEAYRAAISSVREDLKATRQTLRIELQVQAKNARALKVAIAKFRKADTVEFEAKVDTVAVQLSQMKANWNSQLSETEEEAARRAANWQTSSAMELLVAQAKDSAESLRRKKQDMDTLRSEAEVELLALQESAEEQKGEVLDLKGIEESLLFQLPQLKKKLNLAPRYEWEAYRAAITSAREHLKETRQSLRIALQQQAKNERALKVATAKFRKADTAATKVTQAFNLMSGKAVGKAREMEELRARHCREEQEREEIGGEELRRREEACENAREEARRYYEEHQAQTREEMGGTEELYSDIQGNFQREMQRRLKDLGISHDVHHLRSWERIRVNRMADE